MFQNSDLELFIILVNKDVTTFKKKFKHIFI